MDEPVSKQNKTKQNIAALPAVVRFFAERNWGLAVELLNSRHPLTLSKDSCLLSMPEAINCGFPFTSPVLCD